MIPHLRIVTALFTSLTPLLLLCLALAPMSACSRHGIPLLATTHVTPPDAAQCVPENFSSDRLIRFAELMQQQSSQFLRDSELIETKPSQRSLSFKRSLAPYAGEPEVRIAFDEGDQFPTLNFTKRDSGTSSTLRLDPFLRREDLRSISRIAVSPDMSQVALIAKQKKSGTPSLLIVNRTLNTARRFDYAAYDLMWLNDATLMFTSLVNEKPRGLFIAYADTTPTQVYASADAAQEVLFAPHHPPQQAFIELRSPTTSSIFSVTAAQPLILRPILTDDLPGAACTELNGRYVCLSYKHHASGEAAILNDSERRTILRGSPDQPLVSIDSDQNYLRVFFSTGTATGVQLVSNDLRTVLHIEPLGPVTTLAPAQPVTSKNEALIRVRSFLEPTHTLSTAHLLQSGAAKAPSARTSQPQNTYPVTEQALLVPSSTGDALIPVSLVRPHQVRGLIVQAYGAYGIPLHAEHSEQIDSLLAHGIAVALVHVRGGGELGPAWHKSGSGPYKRRAVDDLLTATRYVQDHLGVSPQQTLLRGRSAGGWLVTKAALTDNGVCAGIILEAPLLNLTGATSAPDSPLYHRDRNEWGPPVTAQSLSATPISSQQRLPFHILVTIPSQDELIPPDETLSWALQARCTQASGYAMLVHMIRGASHGGPNSKQDEQTLTNLESSFIVQVVSAYEQVKDSSKTFQ